MATYQTTLETPAAPEKVFDYLARFSSAVEWDPGVVASKDLSSGEVVLGSAFQLTVHTLGRDVLYRYEVTAIDRPREVTLRGEAGSFATTDTITVARGPEDGLTRVTYRAVLEISGIARLLAPVMPIAFKRICDRAAVGLQREIAHLGGQTNVSSDGTGRGPA